MEIYQVLQERIPERKKVIARCKKTGMPDLSRFLLQMMKNMKKEEKESALLNAFFIELYDMLYPYIVFDKIKIAKKITRVLEGLALPIKYVGEERWKENLRKMKKIKLP